MIKCQQCNREYDNGSHYCSECNIDLNSGSRAGTPLGLSAFSIACAIVSLYALLSYMLYGALFWGLIGFVLSSAITKLDNKKELTLYKLIQWFFAIITLITICLMITSHYCIDLKSGSSLICEYGNYLSPGPKLPGNEFDNL